MFTFKLADKIFYHKIQQYCNVAWYNILRHDLKDCLLIHTWLPKPKISEQIRNSKTKILNKRTTLKNVMAVLKLKEKALIVDVILFCYI